MRYKDPLERTGRGEKGECGFEKLPGTTQRNTEAKPLLLPPSKGLGDLDGWVHPGLAMVGLGIPGGSSLWQVPSWYCCSGDAL